MARPKKDQNSKEAKRAPSSKSPQPEDMTPIAQKVESKQPGIEPRAIPQEVEAHQLGTEPTPITSVVSTEASTSVIDPGRVEVLAHNPPVQSSETSTAIAQPQSYTPVPTRSSGPDIAGSKWKFKYLWNGTALYIWIKLFSYFLGIHFLVELTEQCIATFVANRLSFINFAPPNADILPYATKFMWVLYVAEFNPITASLLFFYVLSFPVIVPLYFCFKIVINIKSVREAIAQSATQTTTVPVPMPTPPSKNKSWYQIPKLPVTAIASWGLFIWFLLFGDATSPLSIYPGILLSFLLFVTLTMKLITFTRPYGTSSITFYKMLRKIDVKLNELKIYDFDSQTVKNKSGANAYFCFYYCLRKYYNFTIKRLVGIRGRSLISMFVVLVYIAALFLVGMSQVIFWALVLKSIIPSAPLLACLQYGTSHILPFMDHPRLPVELPYSMKICPAISTFILFCLTAGTVGSFMVERQKDHVQVLKGICKIYRQSRIRIKGSKRKLKMMQSTLPETS